MLFFLLICLISSRYYFFFEKLYIYEYVLLLFLVIEGSFLMLMSEHLFLVLLAMEMQTLCFFVFSALKRYSNFSTEAAIKY